MDVTFLSELGYILLNPAEIAKNMRMVRDNPNVNAAAMFRIHDILAGRIQFTSKGSPEELPGSEVLAPHWDRFVHLSLMQLFALGFTACITDGDETLDHWYRNNEYRRQRGEKVARARNEGPTGGWEWGMGPEGSTRKLDGRDFAKAKHETLRVHVLDMEKLDVYWRGDIASRNTFRFFVRADSTDHISAFFGDNPMHQREIHHVFWSVMDAPVMYQQHPTSVQYELAKMRMDRAPSKLNVRLTSHVSRLFGLLDLNRHNVDCHKIGTIHMSNPTILLQDQPRALDPNESGSMGLNMAAHGISPAGEVERKAELETGVKIASNQQQEYDDAQALMSIAGAPPTEAVSTIHVTAGETQVVEMAPSKAVARQNVAQAVPYMMEMMYYESEQIWVTMGIPLAVQLNINPAKKSSMTVGQSAGAAHEGRDSMAKLSFQGSQRGLRERVIMYSQSMLDYMTLYHRTLVKDVIKGAGGEGTIQIRLPGMPDPEDVVALWKMGAIKYEFMTSVVGAGKGIVAEAWNKKCLLDLQDLNGIKKEESQDPSDAGKLLSDLAHKKKKQKKR